MALATSHHHCGSPWRRPLRLLRRGFPPAAARLPPLPSSLHFSARGRTETADRPGLLLEIIRIITDRNIDVESAEIDTEGFVAKHKFHVSYRGAKLNSSLSQVLIDCLRYYLRRPETDEGRQLLIVMLASLPRTTNQKAVNSALSSFLCEMP